MALARLGIPPLGAVADGATATIAASTYGYAAPIAFTAGQPPVATSAAVPSQRTRPHRHVSAPASVRGPPAPFHGPPAPVAAAAGSAAASGGASGSGSLSAPAGSYTVVLPDAAPAQLVSTDVPAEAPAAAPGAPRGPPAV